MTSPAMATLERRWTFLFSLGFLFAAAVGLGWTGVIPPGVIGISAGAWPLVALGLVLVWLVLYWLLWRCPACGRYPGSPGPFLDCRHCGVPLMRPEMSREEWDAEEREWEWNYALRVATANLAATFLLPLGTFCLTLFVGLWDGLREASHKAQGNESDLPLLIVLGIFVSLSALGVYFGRSSRRYFEKGGMPLRQSRRMISGTWIVMGGVMIVAGCCVFGYIALSRMGGPHPFGLVDRPGPLAIAFSIYVLAGALVLGNGWRALREAKNDLELRAGGNEEAAREAEWFQRSELIKANERQSGGSLLFVFAAFVLVCLLGMGHGTGTLRLVAIGFFTLAAGFGAIFVGRSRLNLAAAGFSPEQVRHRIADVWTFGGALMILIGAFALAGLFAAADLLEPAKIWSIGSAFAVYTLTGVFLLWRNWRFRKPPAGEDHPPV